MSKPTAPAIKRPSLALLCAEPFRAAAELARHRFGKSHDAKPGDGHPLMAPSIRQVITIGTPFNTEADHTNVGWLFRLLSGGSPASDPVLSLRLRTPPPMRTTSIYSRSDGVVAWQTCRHHKPSVLVHDIEVGGSHLGMNWNRDVLAVVADRLGQQTGPWRRYMRTH